MAAIDDLNATLTKYGEGLTDIKTALTEKGVYSADTNITNVGTKIRSIAGSGSLLDGWLIDNGYSELIQHFVNLLTISKSKNESTDTIWTDYTNNSVNTKRPIIVDPKNVIELTTNLPSYQAHIFYIGSNFTCNNLTTLSGAFRNNQNMHTFLISNFPTIENTNNCFSFNISLERIPEKMNFPICTNIGNMFSNCKSLKEINIGVHPISQVSFDSFVNSCDKLKKITINDGGVMLVSTSMANSFYNCYELEEINCILDVVNVTNYSYSFNNCTSLKTVRIKNLNTSITINASSYLTVESMVYMFENATTVIGKTINVGATNLAKLTATQKAIATGKGFTLV